VDPLWEQVNEALAFQQPYTPVFLGFQMRAMNVV
jgi:hypothetical protein